jgi:acetoin utilization deacetylase AcuC-like enzyme
VHRVIRIPVFYSPRQLAHPASYSPSAGKPAKVVADWLEAGFPIEVREPEPVTRDTLALAHTRRFVDAIMECRARNGFGESSRGVADSLPWTSGSFLSAAREALVNRRVAVSPTSGFHHAGRDSALAFCTFNGLMVAALKLRAEARVQRIAILDGDFHYGNGTVEIIKALGIDWIRHVTGGMDDDTDPDAYLANLADVVRGFADCDLLLYQAGADPHIDDPLGGFLTTAQLAERDRIVFTMARRIGLPVAWNLAGGYQRPLGKVLEIHRNTMAAAQAVFVDREAVEAAGHGVEE